MTPEQIERVFGRGRLKMVTGEHVEVFREAVAPGERRRYTKRFLTTHEGDFGQWTEREWRILARLIGHGIACVPDVVQYDRGRVGGVQLVQTYDAGVTVDQWATLLPVSRDGRTQRHVFEDCAHWWAFAHHCLRALHEIHPLELIHLDVKGDNVCIPYAPNDFDPLSAGERLRPAFGQLALIDFAFSLVSRESLTTPLPIGWQKDYDYQSPRLLAALEAGRNGDMQPTRELDWRCDMYSLAAMLERYLPEWDGVAAAGWTESRYQAAKTLIRWIRDTHDGELTPVRPHAALIAETGARLEDSDLRDSLERGWTLAHDVAVASHAASPLTPVTLLTPITRLAPSVQVTRSGRTTAVRPITALTVVTDAPDATAALAAVRAEPGTAAPARRSRVGLALAALVALAAVGVLAWQAVLRFVPAELPASAATEDRSAPEPRAKSLARSEPETRASAPQERLAHDPPSDTAGTGPTQSPGDVSPAAPSASPVRDAGARSGATTRAPIVEPPVESKRAVESTPSQKPAEAAPSPAPESPPLAAAKGFRGAARSRWSVAHPLPPVASPSPVRAAPDRPASVARRPLPSWVSLEPPAWLRTGKPPNPPGVAPAEPRAQPLVADASREAVSAKAERASAAEAPVTVHGAPSPTVARDPLPATDRATPPPSSKRSWLGVAQAAPIEDRSEPLTSPIRAPEPPPAPPEDYAAQGRRMLADAVPRFALQAEPEVARVLWLASADDPARERIVADAARALRVQGDGSLGGCSASATDARRLGEARAAAGSRRNVNEAFDLQLRAFGANPRDPEVAGNLALLHLKLAPPQPDRARQLALWALAARCPEFASARLEDWNTFAVASALSGREADATRALFVTLALGGDGEARCVAALNTLSSYGERMRGPVEAMFYRMRSQGRGNYSPACAWPATWMARRLP